MSKVKLSTVTRRREPAEKTVHFLLCFFFQNVSNLLPKNRNNVKNRSNPTTLERLRAAEAEFGTTIGLPKTEQQQAGNELEGVRRNGLLREKQK